MKKGMVYKIELQDEIYIGSTEQKLCVRQSNHNTDLKRHTNRKLYKKCIEQGVDKIKCIWVADIEFNSTAEKRKIEEDYRKKLNAGLNSKRCYRTEQETKEYQKIFYEKNKEQILEKTKERYEIHKEQILEKSKEYYKNNKEKIAEKNKEYYEKNKDAIDAKQKEKIECPICKSIVNRNALARHQRTTKCMKCK